MYTYIQRVLGSDKKAEAMLDIIAKGTQNR